MIFNLPDGKTVPATNHVEKAKKGPGRKVQVPESTNNHSLGLHTVRIYEGLGRCYPLFSLTEHPVCDLHNSSLCSLVCRRWNSPKSHRKTEPLTQYAEMDYTGFPDLLSVYGGAGTHLFISWTAGPLSSLTILILKHHSPYYFPSLATKCLVLIDGSLNSAWDLTWVQG